MKMAGHTHKKAEGVTSVIAREGNGNIQITFTIPFKAIKEAQEDTIAEMAADIEVPGFRKGKAPLAKVREKISDSKLVEHSLGHILPGALADAIDSNKLKIAIYPKFELISAKENEAWQIKGTTCELPEVKLGDYKKEIAGALRKDSIVTPDKLAAGKGKELTKEEKEGVVIKALLDSVKIEIPQILIEEEADSRLSNLLSRLEKLGLALEGYLNSINKKAEDLRAEYAMQAKDAITLDLALTKVAEEEGLKVSEKDLADAFSMSQATNKEETDPEGRKRLLESILRRRMALDSLMSIS